MSGFKIRFNADPETGPGPWANRKSSRRKMMQSITDYLVQRCGCTNVTIMEVIDTPVAAESPAKKRAAKR